MKAESNGRLSRRQVLRGASVALALPWLESVAPRPARAGPAVSKRFLPIYLANGASLFWRNTTGSGQGGGWGLSDVLSPFAPVKSKMLMVRNLANFTWRADLLDPGLAWESIQPSEDPFCGGCQRPNGAFITPSHSRAPAAFMNCIDGDAYRQSRGLPVLTAPDNPQTVDDLIATRLGLRSLQVGLFNGDGIADQRNFAFSRTMTFDAAGQPKPKQIDPARIFTDLFGTTEQVEMDAEQALTRGLAASRLDVLAESITSLSMRLGRRDQETLEQFLTGVREIEVNMSALNGNCAAARAMNIEPSDGLLGPGEVGYDSSNPNIVTAEKQMLRARTMNDVIVLAMQCDSAQVVSYMLDNSRSDLAYDWLTERDFFTPGAPPLTGACGAYHEMSHASLTAAGQGASEGTARNQHFHTITEWHCQVVADLVRKLDAVSDLEGSLLDNSVVMFSSGMHHADHAAWDLPFVLFGGGSGTFRQDELINLPGNVADMRQLRDFYFTLLNNYFNLGVSSFGDDQRGLPNALITELLA